MKNRTYLLLIGVVLMACSQSEAKKNTGSGCAQKLKGEWAFGRAPYGCAVSASIANPLEDKYSELTYKDSQQGNQENRRYVNLMHDFLSDYATDYYKRREPNASNVDVKNWVRLVLATANQESYWTQYRFGKDNVFRMFKGDGNHGYGIMQIDDRSHKKFIQSNKVYDINPHMVYALDMLYDMQAKAKRKPCGGLNDATSIARSAYSAYNGGPGAKCRWRTNSKWSQNDKGFLQKYNDRSWEKNLVASN